MNKTQTTNFVDKEWMHMIKKLAWNTFKNTGNIDTFMEFMAIQNLEKNIDVNENIKVNEYGDNKNQGFDNIGK